MWRFPANGTNDHPLIFLDDVVVNTVVTYTELPNRTKLIPRRLQRLQYFLVASEHGWLVRQLFLDFVENAVSFVRPQSSEFGHRVLVDLDRVHVRLQL